MSMDDSQQEDCTVYIEELKSDNPSLKINAASKLPVIASVLGHNRIRDQLVPYLIQIIEQMDNQNQFLIKIAEGLYQCKGHCKSQSESYILIPPLRILASLDQPSVRQKAVQSLLKICEDSNKQFYEKNLFPLIVSMSDKKNLYSPRVSASSMITACYPNVSEGCQLELQKIFKRLGLEENSPLVRRSIAENLQKYSKVVPKNVTKSDGLQIWQKFIVDKIDIVKIKALQCAAVLARFFKKEEISDKFFKYIKLVDPEKKSWRIRYALIQSLSALLPFLEKDLIKKDTVQIFQQLLKDNQAEVRTISLLKLPELTQKLTQQQSYNVFFQYVQKAAKDASINVKMALVESVVPYLATVEKDKVTQNGVSLLMILIKDQNQVIRTGIVQRLKDLSEVMGEENTQRFLLPMIESSLTDKKWRFKLAVAQSIKGLFKSLDPVKNKAFMDKILKTFVKDHYAAVRQQTIASLCELKGVLGSQRCMQLVGETIKNLVNQSNCYYRITGIQSLKNALQVLDKNDFNEVFSTVCKKLENEKVPNVLLTLLVLYPKIKASLTAQTKKQFQVVLRKAKELKDEDVLYFAEKVQQG